MFQSERLMMTADKTGRVSDRARKMATGQLAKRVACVLRRQVQIQIRESAQEVAQLGESIIFDGKSSHHQLTQL